jgi:glycosyltransferase involved in cell wall biosynthesis
MYNVWFAIEDRASAATLKKADFGNLINPVWFPVTGDTARPFPTLPQAVQRSKADLLFYESHHQPLPPLSLLKQVPTIISLDAAPLRPFSRERNVAAGNSLSSLLQAVHEENSKSEKVLAAVRQAAGFIVWSEWARQELIGNFGVEPGRVLVARSGVDLEEWDAAHAAYDIARRRETSLPERIRLLFAGDDFEALGGDVLLKVFKRNPELAELCELHFITRRASASVYIKELVPDLNLHLHLHPTHEPAELYLNSDVYVLPARQATSPSQVATALAAGLPIITSDVEGLSELVHHRQTGLLIEPPGDEKALYNALAMLVGDPELRYRLGQNARREAENQFDARHNSRQILDFVQKTLRSSFSSNFLNNVARLPQTEFSYRT